MDCNCGREVMIFCRSNDERQAKAQCIEAYGDNFESGISGVKFSCIGFGLIEFQTGLTLSDEEQRRMNDAYYSAYKIGKQEFGENFNSNNEMLIFSSGVTIKYILQAIEHIVNLSIKQ
ncbi:hypothetical protein BB561_006604 [Smittium simulii]|uniref:Uncharacterized protein n=1 Tax=Smittium simulii TaxID=133385 RepID=A0A2T9Y326_9FUNG|nr:hypothetical protein BB561_006604 [Smittium simulii]